MRVAGPSAFDALQWAFTNDLNRIEPGRADSRTRLRIAKAGGVGIGVSVLLCCVLPIAVGAVAGASVAGPLLGLDAPFFIGAGAVLFGARAGERDRRRTAKQAAAPSCGC